MKELNRKVFKTIFLILSLFIVTGIIIYNVSSYKKEYDNVKFFGINENSNGKLRGQVSIFYYNNRDDFAIKLITK